LLFLQPLSIKAASSVSPSEAASTVLNEVLLILELNTGPGLGMLLSRTALA
jgi:mannitol-specific phosphotransferase system IIBC component